MAFGLSAVAPAHESEASIVIAVTDLTLRHVSSWSKGDDRIFHVSRYYYAFTGNGGQYNQSKAPPFWEPRWKYF